jgi:hypothetical protein
VNAEKRLLSRYIEREYPRQVFGQVRTGLRRGRVQRRGRIGLDLGERAQATTFIARRRQRRRHHQRVGRMQFGRMRIPFDADRIHLVGVLVQVGESSRTRNPVPRQNRMVSMDIPMSRSSDTRCCQWGRYLIGDFRRFG